MKIIIALSYIPELCWSFYFDGRCLCGETAERFRLSRRGPTVSFRIQQKPLAGRGRAGGGWLDSETLALSSLRSVFCFQRIEGTDYGFPWPDVEAARSCWPRSERDHPSANLPFSTRWMPITVHVSSFPLA